MLGTVLYLFIRFSPVRSGTCVLRVLVGVCGLRRASPFVFWMANPLRGGFAFFARGWQVLFWRRQVVVYRRREKHDVRQFRFDDVSKMVHVLLNPR